MRIKEPKIFILEENLPYEEEMRKSKYNDMTFHNVHKMGYSMDECHFIKVHFHHCSFIRMDAMDLRFENCDLSNICFSEGSMHRIVFKNCRLSGCDFSVSLLQDIVFENCQMPYTNFSGTHINNVFFNQCNIKESSFNEVKIKHLFFKNCHLEESEFLHCPLAGCDLSTSNIDGIKVNIESLKGVIVNSYQASSLAKLMGLKIKE